MSSRLSTLLLALLGGLLLSALPDAGAAAAEPRDYAYLFVQGRINDPFAEKPLIGARVLLTQGAEVFVATTDQRGVFRFEKLPLGAYELEIRTTDGRVMHAIQQSDATSPGRLRMRVKIDKGAPLSLHLETIDDRVEVVVPEPHVDRRKLWRQVGIFVGALGLLAL